MIGVGMDITERRRAQGEIFVLNAELEGRLERIHALREIDRAITGSLDLPFTLGVVLDQALGQLEIDAAAVLLCRPHQATLEYAAYRGYRRPPPADSRSGSTRGRPAAPSSRAALSTSPPRPACRRRCPNRPGPRGSSPTGPCRWWPRARSRACWKSATAPRWTPSPSGWSSWRPWPGRRPSPSTTPTLFEGLRRSNLELSLAYDATIEGWSRAMDLRDHETEGHSRRVTEMTLRLARAMGMGEAELVHVRRGALLHDIGKMGIPDRILLKPGPLTDEELAVMRRHPAYAFEMLSPIAFLRPALDIPYCHHEKWDGTGYPRGLKGEQIPLAARIFAAVDIWDALRSDRPYRKAWPEERVCEHIASLAGTHLDPDVVRAFCNTSTRGSLSGRHPPRSRSPGLPSRPMTIKAGTDLENRFEEEETIPRSIEPKGPGPGEFGRALIRTMDAEATADTGHRLSRGSREHSDAGTRAGPDERRRSEWGRRRADLGVSSLDRGPGRPDVRIVGSGINAGASVRRHQWH